MVGGKFGCIGVALAAITLASSHCRAAVPESRVYTIGTDNAYPYHFLNEQGAPQGMIGEVIAAAARRAGIQLAWSVQRDGPTSAMKNHRVELWPLVAYQPAFWPGMHFTRPYL